MNPFRYGKIVTGEFYCPRPEDIRLKNAFSGGRNVALIGRRRVGKSSSIHNVVSAMRPRHTLVYFDFYQVRGVDDMVQRMLRALPSQTFDWLRDFARGLTRLRPKLELDPTTGTPSIGIGSEAVLDEQTLEDLLIQLGKMRNTVIAFDEFQDVAIMKTGEGVLARMRSVIQQQLDSLYVFSGSSRKMMTALFENSTQPFFQAAEKLEIGPIPTKKFTNWIVKRFQTRTIHKETAASIVEEFEGIPGDIQRFCAALWDVSLPGKPINAAEHLPLAKDYVLESHSSTYNNIFYRYTVKQRQVLIALAKLGTKSPHSSEFLKKAAVSSQVSQKAIKRLLSDAILSRDEDGLFFDDQFFAAWIRRMHP